MVRSSSPPDGGGYEKSPSGAGLNNTHPDGSKAPKYSTLIADTSTTVEEHRARKRTEDGRSYELHTEVLQ